MDEREKFPISRESLKGFARYLVYELAGRRNPPAVVDIYSSRECDRGAVKLFCELLASTLLEERQLFEVRQKKAPVARAFLDPASDFYSIDLGYYSNSGGIPADMTLPLGAAFIQSVSPALQRGIEEYFPQFARQERRILGHITEGTVIDHIPAGRVWKLVELLELNTPHNSRTVSLGDNYDSHRLGKKGVLKVQGQELDQKQLNFVAFYAEGATVSSIRVGRVVKKIKMGVPERLEGIVLCPASGCNSRLISHARSYAYKCNECATDFSLDQLKFIGYLEFP